MGEIIEAAAGAYLIMAFTAGFWFPLLSLIAGVLQDVLEARGK